MKKIMNCLKQKRGWLSAGLLGCFLFQSSAVLAEPAIYQDSSATPEARTTDLIARMTLEEKVDQLAGMGTGKNVFGDAKAGVFGTRGNKRLGIPDLITGHGITGVRSGRDQYLKATYMMAPCGIASTWDTNLYSRASSAVAQEMRAYRQDLSLGVTMNIIRNPLGGRSWEAFSEDPYLTARLAVANVKATQANGIISGPKHFVANNQERNRHDINNEMDERTLREIYLPGFKAAVVEGGALNLMASYNRLNGTFMCENKWILTDILRKEWGFHGFVLSDFGKGVRSTVASAEAGMNIEMSGPTWYGQKLLDAVNNGELEESVVDRLLYDKLWTMFTMGLFEPRENPAVETVHCEAHQEIALEVARKAAILLKNENGILPLKRAEMKTLAVIGPNAKRFGGMNYSAYLQGGGSGSCYYFNEAVTNPKDEIAALAKGVEVRYARGCHADTSKSAKKKKLEATTWMPDAQDVADAAKSDEQLIAEAVVLAKSVDQVVLVVGMNGTNESEGSDRANAVLPGEQEALIRAVAEANPKTVVVLVGGAYMEARNWIDEVDGVICQFYCGEKISQAMAEVLFGEVNPSGKLAVSYPKRVDQYPESTIFTGPGYSERKISNVYSEGVFVGYRYFDKQQEEMLFPFGFGLSYTEFEYSDLKVIAGDPVQVSLTVKNSGAFAGDEIVQLYVQDVKSSVPRPVRELKGFARLSLKPGESKTARFTLKDDAFAFWSPVAKDWVVEPGRFVIGVGANSRDIRLTDFVEK